VKSTRIAAATLALGLVALSPVLSGCFQGQGATTTMQATMNSGNGVQGKVGEITLDGLTLVLGPEGSTTATLVGRLVNAGGEDSLTTVAIGTHVSGVSPDVQFSDDLRVILPDAAITIGYDSDTFISVQGFEAAPATYVPIALGFRNAGIFKTSVMVVPAEGMYAGIDPKFPVLDAPASAEPTAEAVLPEADASASASASASPAAS